MSWNWKYFTPEELLSPDGLRAYDRGILVIQPILLHTLEYFRAEVGHPLIVNGHGHLHRGYRSFKENLRVGGEEFSYHMQGLAADISCKEISVQELYMKALSYSFTGIGCYPGRGFVHCDVRPLLTDKKVTWTR